jgi:hypothetical protein
MQRAELSTIDRPTPDAVASVRTNRFCVALLLSLAATLGPGCRQSPDGPGNVPNQNASDPNGIDLVLALEPAAKFEVQPGVPNRQAWAVDVSTAVPAVPPTETTIVFDPQDIAVMRTSADMEASATLKTYIASIDDVDVCSSGVPLANTQIWAGTNGTVAVTPESLDVTPGTASLLTSGRFSLCLEVFAARAESVQIDAITLRFVERTDLSTFTCDEISALAPVQAAVATLEDNRLAFTLPSGNAPALIEGIYAMRQEVTFDPYNFNTNGIRTGTITFAAQTDASVSRSGFGASVDQTIVGTANEVGLCVLARTYDLDCDQTIALLESLTISTNGMSMAGNTLAVVIERHDAQKPTCGDRGDFRFGTVSFTPATSP